MLAHDPFVDAQFAAANGVEYVPLPNLLSQADVISLHAPLTSDTHHLINSDAIARMKRGVILINTSRGALVDSVALIEGLKSGAVGAAGLDVYEEEEAYFFEDFSAEIMTDDVLARLISFGNVLVTSHQAFLTWEALGNIADITFDNIAEFVAGRRGLN
ncbi:D-isomer specific 2-hydroxyacid dehydrogenase, NAD binding domain protein [Mycobacterium kansasii 824]|uniref:D-isomer specific 2-hydroxyacid dehydrogenase, NAD binding domain protein n=1 Tax=Mycobacterium kansasii TaxID=1768 RepID=A0A1V3WMC2_MYCKA|nr:D-isomer specific 2-hydroxyacid dehydrogenase, NAD binding domain protein [Mycobacterium kansasii 824]OOK67992.1 D-isomer specific 2-hydroxyacid dehydrogenase, NAD binding domain protein [Mycobacterium kansasii]